MHCNLRPFEPRQFISALITTPCQVWRSWTYPIAALYVALFLLIHNAVNLIFDPMTLTFDLWPSTFAVYRPLCDKTLYQIWTQSSNPQRSYCDFNIRPNDLEHLLRVALGSMIIFTKFDLRQLICAWIIVFLMLIGYVTLWPWTLTR